MTDQRVSGPLRTRRAANASAPSSHDGETLARSDGRRQVRRATRRSPSNGMGRTSLHTGTGFLLPGALDAGVQAPTHGLSNVLGAPWRVPRPPSRRQELARVARSYGPWPIPRSATVVSVEPGDRVVAHRSARITRLVEAGQHVYLGQGARIGAEVVPLVGAQPRFGQRGLPLIFNAHRGAVRARRMIGEVSPDQAAVPRPVVPVAVAEGRRRSRRRLDIALERGLLLVVRMPPVVRGTRRRCRRAGSRRLKAVGSSVLLIASREPVRGVTAARASGSSRAESPARVKAGPEGWLGAPRGAG
jgi:hypothetical protein